jgi:riboflavin biosynthesis pyrimidine reductase
MVLAYRRPMPRLESLFPPGSSVDALDALAAQRPWERARADRPLVLCNMVASLDGCVTVGGGSTGLGGEGDKAVFHGLRTVVDGVLAGTGTLRAETYGRLVRSPERRAARAALGLAEDPMAIVLTRSGDVPWHAPLFAAPEQEVVVVTRPLAVSVPRDVRARVDVVELEDPSPGAALRALRHSHDLRAVLCEGGPTLNRGLLADGVLDELFLTVAPQLVGGGADVLRVLGGDPLPEPLALELLGVLRHGSEVFLRYALG